MRRSLALILCLLPGRLCGAILGPLTLMVTPSREGHKPVIEAIDAARTSVRLVMFHLTDPKVAKALVAARGRGVDVRVILDQSSLANRKYSSVMKKLAEGGVDVRKSSPGFSITHEKAMVVDGEKAFIMSLNLTNGYKKTRDFGLITSDTNIIGEMISVFEADWQNAQRETAYTPALSLPFLVWSPVNSQQRLASFIDSASRELAATVENLGDPVIQDALIKAAGRGVKVRLIVPMCDINVNPIWNYPFLRALRQGRVEAKVMPYPSSRQHPYMHAKMMAADGARAYVGSINYSVNSTTRARELGILFSDEAAVGGILKVFESDWQSAVPAPDPPPSNCPLPD